MNLLDLIRRMPPTPWAEGDNIPWNEAGFSERMLKEHLSQDHDAASRRMETIDRQVAWIWRALLDERPSRVLDLGCGPGLYTTRLARLGCPCHGIDFSPASVGYARESAAREGLPCTYDLHDLREASFGTGFDLGMLIFGEFNVFQPAHARALLGKAQRAIEPGGRLLLEISTLASVQSIGTAGSSWYASPSGLFSEQPHLCLQEASWDADSLTATTRYDILDAASAAVTHFATTYQGYTNEIIAALLTLSGFSQIRFYPALGLDDPAISPQEFIAISAVRE